MNCDPPEPPPRPDAISPTAHYTGQVWLRRGLSHPELATWEGAALGPGSWPPPWSAFSRTRTSEQGTGHGHDQIEEPYLVGRGTLTMRYLGEVTLAHGRGSAHGPRARPLLDPTWQPLRWRDGKCVWWRICTAEEEAL